MNSELTNLLYCLIKLIILGKLLIQMIIKTITIITTKLNFLLD